MTPGRVRRLALAAPAKVNLGLRVTGVRPDGYHLIDSLFVPIDLVDDVAIELGADSPGEAAITVFNAETAATAEPGGNAGRGAGRGRSLGVGVIDAASVPADDRNLAVVAARAYLDALPRSARRPSVRLMLGKRIPLGAGLGGGSSDAGAVLRGLSELLSEGPQADALADVALGIGADVPFFLSPEPAWVRGIGESITPADGIPRLTLLLVNPGVSVATAEVYRLYDALRGGLARPPVALTPPEAGSTLRALSPLSPLSAGRGGPEDALSRLLACPNDLEPAAVRLCPVIARLRNRLRALGAVGVGMSGSGATVYGVFANDSDAYEALEAARFEPPIWARVVRSVGSQTR